MLSGAFYIDVIITNFVYYGKTVQAQFHVKVRVGFWQSFGHGLGKFFGIGYGQGFRQGLGEGLDKG